MLVWDLEASTPRDLANQIASYIRRGFEVAQIVYSTKENDRKPYKAFLFNKAQLDSYDSLLKEGLKRVELSEDVFKKVIYEIDCKIDKKLKTLVETILYGNTEHLIEIDGKEIFFEFVLILPGKIILKNPIDNISKKPIKIDIGKLKEAICNIKSLIKRL
jgi:hypothetical protein